MKSIDDSASKVADRPHDGRGQRIACGMPVLSHADDKGFGRH